MIWDDMKTFVRTHADADVNDAPDSSLGTYASMAYNDILARRHGWPHLEVSYSLTTIAAQQSYLFSALSVTDLESVTSVIDNSQVGGRLIYVTETDADWYFGIPAAPSSTNAIAYTIVGTSTIKLYPIPAANGTVYTVRGLRNPTTWPTTSGSQADLPRTFDEAICYFMLSQYYASQEDVQMSSFYLQMYNNQVTTVLRDETTKTKVPRPNVVGQNNRYRAVSFLDRARGACQ